MSCALRLMPEPIDLDEDQTVAIFRIVQESLTNVARHAEASCVEVSLSRSTDHPSADHLIVEVCDNGRGFNPGPANKKSFGLIGMRERAAVLGGSIDIASGEGKQGTVISLRLPLKGTDRTS